MNLLSLYTILSYCVSIFACQDCTHIGEYQGGNLYMCDDSSIQSNIELNINIKVPYGTHPPKVISPNSYPSPTKIITPKNENNSSLVLHNLTQTEPSSSYYTPSSTSIPSPVSTPSTESIPSPVSTPSPASIPTPVYKPSPSAPSSLTEKNAPSPSKTPSSKNNADNNIKIIDDTINPSVKTPSSSLRGLNSTKKPMNKAEETYNNEDIVTTKEVDIGVVITISVLSTLLVILVVGGIVYRFKLKKSKVDSSHKVENIEVDAREFRRKFEEAKKLSEKSVNKKLVLKPKTVTSKPNSIANHPKLPEAEKVSKNLPPPIRKKRIITETPPPGMGFKKGDPAPEPNNKGKTPSTPKSET